jgi:hypothetical protein
MRHIFRLSMLVLVLVVGCSAAFAAPPRPKYYRWASTPEVTCLLKDDGKVWVSISQHYEWDLPADNVIQHVMIRNGVESYGGSFTKPAGIDSESFYLPFGDVVSGGYPITYAYRFDTYVRGELVYQSTMSFRCTQNVKPFTVSYNLLSVKIMNTQIIPD